MNPLNPCRNSDSQHTRPVTLVFRRSELLYDAANYSFVEGDIMEADDEHARHQVFDIAEKGNIDRVTRVLNLAHAECVEMLFPYSKEDIPEGQEPMTDVMAAPEVYRIVLNLPDGFSLTTLRLLTHLIHEYLVCRVLADWMSITNPDSEETWEKKFRELKMKIQTSLVSRTGKVRRKCKPF